MLVRIPVPSDACMLLPMGSSRQHTQEEKNRPKEAKLLHKPTIPEFKTHFIF